MRLLVVTENIAEFFCRIYFFIVVITKGYYGCIFFHHANEYRTVTMPPAIMVNQFFAVRIDNHTPAETVISFSAFFKAIRSISAIERRLFKQDITAKGGIPFKHILWSAVNIFITVNHIEVFRGIEPA